MRRSRKLVTPILARLLGRLNDSFLARSYFAFGFNDNVSVVSTLGFYALDLIDADACLSQGCEEEVWIVVATSDLVSTGIP